jgi:hypothetical protein
MTYRYQYTYVKDDKIQTALDNFSGKGWELVTATCCVAGAGIYQEYYHYLYFRQEI